MTSPMQTDDVARWPGYPIKRFAQLVYGDALPHETKDETGDVPVYGSNGSFGRHSEANTAGPVILVGRKGSFGALNWSDVAAFAIDTVYFVDERHASCDLRWLYWALHTAGLDALSQDTGVPGLSRESAYSARLPLPPLVEQTAIAVFLDRETGKIDALVEEQRRLIDLLKEKRQAVISHTVTKGLDPNAKMKPSGVEWLGHVPEHWEVKRLSHLTKPGTSITYGIVQAGPDIEGGVPYIRTSDMAGDALPIDGYLRTTPDIDEAYSRSRVEPGDIVIAIRATIGKPLIVPPALPSANLTQGTAKFSPGARILADFVCHFLRSHGAEREFGRLGKGATFKEITLEMLRKFTILCPPLPEQHVICGWLLERTSQFDTLIADAARAVELLGERRAALISAAVTGKIDVQQGRS